MSVSIAIVGIREVVAAMKKEEKKWVQAEAAAIYQWGLKLIQAAHDITPRHKGVLRASRYVTRPQKTRKGKFFVEAGFGASYAPYVHELTQRGGGWVAMGINWTLPGTGDKFLEKPYRKMRRGGLRWIARQTKFNKKTGIGFRGITSNVPTRPKRDK